VHDGEWEWQRFVDTYGHLRPGTYDIASPRYDAEPEVFLRPFVTKAEVAEPSAQRIAWGAATRQRISREVDCVELSVSAEVFETFLRSAIEGRELGKFLVTRNISGALEALAELGAAAGLSRQDLSHVTIEEYWMLRRDLSSDPDAALTRMVEAGKEASLRTQATCLPAQIFSPADLTCFEQAVAQPNFVTNKKLTAEVVIVSATEAPREDVRGRIVVIPSADPGFDWLFSRGISGLITMYGGANSHMAIRASEFQIPAAVGVGEILYAAVENASVVELDCAARRIKVVH
jgi:phosphohistidine swiveling domain-containing protein